MKKRKKRRKPSIVIELVTDDWIADRSLILINDPWKRLLLTMLRYAYVPFFIVLSTLREHIGRAMKITSVFDYIAMRNSHRGKNYPRTLRVIDFARNYGSS